MMTGTRHGSMVKPSQVQMISAESKRAPPASPREPSFNALIPAQWPKLPFHFRKYVSLDDKFCGHPKNAEEHPTPCKFLWS